MTEIGFLERFTKRIRELATFKGKPFGRDPLEYARIVGPIYWRECSPEGMEPEECADEDAAYWSPVAVR